jgi:hypothetical protein
MAMLKIDGVDMPTPIKCDIPNFDLDSDDSNRNEEGYFQRDRIRDEIYKLELEWRNISSADLAKIKLAIKPAQVEVTFPTETGDITKTMYAGDRKIEMAVYDVDFTKRLWNISFNLIEY